MGISICPLKILIKECIRKKFSGNLLTIGKQDVLFDLEQFQSISNEFHFSPAPSEHSFSPKEGNKAKGWISDVCLFTLLGFSKAESLDCSSYENADHIFDLNSGPPPKELIGRYDVIFDGGSLEHIFHLPNALNNIFLMLKPGGRIIHINGSSNQIDHGFFMFCPTFFWDFYEVNKFQIDSLLLAKESAPNTTRNSWELFCYTPLCLEKVSFGGLDDSAYHVICIATKTLESTGHKIPSQSRYMVNFWKTKKIAIPAKEAKPKSHKQIVYYIKQTIKKSELLTNFLIQIFKLPDGIWRFFRFQAAGAKSNWTLKKMPIQKSDTL